MKGQTMTPEEICHYYDTHLNLTLRELSAMTGRTIPQLKKILMNETAPAPRRVSDVFNISGREYYRNKAGRCEDAPCCGCCTI
jgi:hypothetical protein